MKVVELAGVLRTSTEGVGEWIAHEGDTAEPARARGTPRARLRTLAMRGIIPVAPRSHFERAAFNTFEAQDVATRGTGPSP